MTVLGVKSWQPGAWLGRNGSYTGLAELPSNVFVGEHQLIKWEDAQVNWNDFSPMDSIDADVQSAQAAGVYYGIDLRVKDFNVGSFANTRVPQFMADGYAAGQALMLGHPGLPLVADASGNNQYSMMDYNPRANGRNGVSSPALYRQMTNTSHPLYDTDPFYVMTDNYPACAEILRWIANMRDRWQNVAAFDHVSFPESASFGWAEAPDNMRLPFGTKDLGKAYKDATDAEIKDFQSDFMALMTGWAKEIWPEVGVWWQPNHFSNQTLTREMVDKLIAKGCGLSGPDLHLNSDTKAYIAENPQFAELVTIIARMEQTDLDITVNRLNNQGYNLEALYNHLTQSADMVGTSPGTGINAHYTIYDVQGCVPYPGGWSTPTFPVTDRSECGNPTPNTDGWDWDWVVNKREGEGATHNQTVPAERSGNTPTPPPPSNTIFINVGAVSNFTDPNGNVWIPDTNIFTASTNAVIVTDNTTIDAGSLTSNHLFAEGVVPSDVMTTHRRHQASNVGDTMTWTPAVLEGAVKVTLIFSEPFFQVNDGREFSYSIDGGGTGSVNVVDFDIYELAGSRDFCYSVTHENVMVDSNEILTITLANEAQDRALLQAIVIEQSTTGLTAPTIDSITNETGDGYTINITAPTTGTPTGYRVSVNGALHQTIVGTGTALAVTGLEESITYDNEVQAEDTTQSPTLVSGLSNTAQATTLDVTPPGQVQGLAVSRDVAGDNFPTWSEEADAENYIIERDTGGGFTLLATNNVSLPNPNIYQDVGGGATDSYRVRADDLAGNQGAYSDTVTPQSDPTATSFTVELRDGQMFDPIALSSANDPSGNTIFIHVDDIPFLSAGRLIPASGNNFIFDVPRAHTADIDVDLPMRTTGGGIGNIPFTIEVQTFGEKSI